MVQGQDGRSQDLRTAPTVTELHGKFNFGGRTAQNDHLCAWGHADRPAQPSKCPPPAMRHCPSFFATTLTNSALSSSNWALENAVNDRLRVYTTPTPPPGALKRVTSFLMLDLDQSGRSVAIAVVVFPAAIQPRTTSTSCAFHAVPRPMEIDAKIEGSVKILRVQWLSDEQIITTSTHSMCGNACHRLFKCTETVFLSLAPRVDTHLPLPDAHTATSQNRAKMHDTRSRIKKRTAPQEFQLNQDAFFSLDFGRGVRDPGASLLHNRLQLLAGGFAVALEIFVRCSFLLSLLGYFLCHLLQVCHNSPDGIHLVPHLHGTNSRQRQIGKGKKQKCRPSNHDCAVSTYHCFVCSDKKPEPEVAKGRNNELQLGRCTVLCGAAGSHVRQPTRNISASPYPI